MSVQVQLTCLFAFAIGSTISIMRMRKNISVLENKIENAREFFPAPGEALDPCPSEKNSRPVPDVFSVVCTCTIDTARGVVLDAESGCPRGHRRGVRISRETSDKVRETP